MPWGSPYVAVKQLDQVHRHTALLMVCHHVLLLFHYKWHLVLAFLDLFHILYEVSVHMRFQNSNGNKLFKESFMWLLHASTPSHSYIIYALLLKLQLNFNYYLNTEFKLHC